MKQTRWLTEAKAIADQAAGPVAGVYFIMPTGDYTEFEELDEGYAVVSAVELGKLWQKEYGQHQANCPDDYSIGDYIADECLYATNHVGENPRLEPEREEIEHYLEDYYSDHYQRDMPTGDYTFGLVFYAKVNPMYSGLIEDLLERIRERELELTESSIYQPAIREAIERRINDINWSAINWAYECWEGQVKDDYHWIQSVGRVGRCGGNIKIISSWPETTEELAEIAQDCAKIKEGIDAEVKWLESEEFRLQEYRAAFGLYESEEPQTCDNCDFINCTETLPGGVCQEWKAKLAVEPCS